MSTTTVPQRSEVPVEHTWDTASVFPTDAAWDAELASLLDALPEVANLQGHLQSAAALADGLERYTALVSRLRRVFLYASMFYATDTADPAAVAKRDRAAGVAAQVSAAVAFLEPELLQIGFDTLRRWQAEDRRLVTYAHYFDMLERHQAHVRSAEVEEVLGLVSEPFSAARQTHTILNDANLRFEPASDAAGQQTPITQGTITALLQSPDREVRRTAWEHYADAHLALKNTMANALATGIKQDVFFARVRRYPSALEAAVQTNFIPPTVFHALMASLLGGAAARPRLGPAACL
jgi:oligoendopeptidase F